MELKKGKIKGVYEIILEPHKDKRGFFMRTYDANIFKQYKLNRKWLQESHSFSSYKHTIRGIHFQYSPFTETKLIRVSRGKILFTFIDLRYKSKTFGKWGQVELSSTKNNLLYVSKGFGLCMCTLTNKCDLLYKMDNVYSPKHYDNIKWNDPDLAIKWPIKTPQVISQNDADAQSFREFVRKRGGIKQ